jgi:hypothetical protein
MALFTDGLISTVEDLTAHDSGLLDVASTEGIDLTKKLGLAQEELAAELAVLIPAGNSLYRLVVTTPLRLCHAFRTLMLVYRDAHGRQLNDRYRGKLLEYNGLAKWALERQVEAGFGLVSDPIAKASPPDLTFFSGPAIGAAYYVTVAWVNQTGQEGAAADWRSITVPDGNLLSARAANRPASGSGWNVFVGLSPDNLTLQNEAPLSPEQAWLQESSISATGRPPGAGQTSEYVLTIPRVLKRG